MADKTPVRVVFNASNVATGMAEFQSGDTVGTSFGGTGLSSIGSSLQVLRVNAAGNALEFGTLEDLGDIGSIGSTLTAPSNADFTITTAGTGNIVLNDLTISDNAISTNRSNDDLKINASGSGTVVLENLKVGTSGATVTTILDEDAMGSDSATSLATQQSIKAYVDTQDANIASDTLTLTNKTFDVEGTGNSISNIDVADFKAAAIVTESEGIGSNDNDTTLPTSAAVKDYVDTQITAEDLDFSADDSTVLSIDLDSEVLHFAGGNGISTSVSNNTVTHAIDTGTVVTLTGSQTLTNKVLTNPTINAFSGTGNGSITGTLSIDNTTTGDSLLITSTEDSNSAAPVITLKRNSGSPDDADYIGRIQFKGENDADQAVTYARISGKILDASDGTEDGAIEFNTIKAGSSTISARLNSDELKLLNGTTLDVDGAGTFAGSVTATSVTTNDIASNGSNADITIDPAGTGNINLTAGADVVIPANIGLVLDGTGAEKIESDGTDISFSVGANGDINIPADIGLTFGNDGEKIEGDGTDLTITGNNIKLTAATDVIIPTNIGLHFTDANEKIESDGSKLTLTSGGTAFALPTSDGSNGEALVTNGSGVLSFAAAGSSNPSSADGEALGSASLEWSDLFLADGGTIQFGNDQEVRLIHTADTGLILKHTATADDKPVSLTLQTGETDMAANDVIGKIDFQAPDEGTGTDAILVAAGIEAVAEGDFSSSNNATKLSFKTASSEAAAEKMSLSSAGLLTIADDLIIGDGKTIGSASDPDAITIASGGGVTLTQALAGTSADFDGGITVDNITIDGTEIDLSSGDFTLDVAGRITLSADDNGEVKLADGSSVYGQFKDDDDRLRIESLLQDKDIMFVGNDGGAEVTAASFDMSDAGAMTISNGLKLTDGNITFSGSGHGIHLGVTSATAANLLDDYEEGTFTPELSSNTNDSIDNYDSQVGRYTKIGRLVVCSLYIDGGTKGTVTGSVARVSNLPFSPDSSVTYQAGAVGFWSNFDIDDTQLMASVYGSNNFAYLFRTSTDNGYIQVTNGQIGDNCRVALTLAYNT